MAGGDGDGRPLPCQVGSLRYQISAALRPSSILACTPPPPPPPLSPPSVQWFFTKIKIIEINNGDFQLVCNNQEENSVFSV